ncbi:hypothetical protein [Paraburkholderia humisilvae]|uniref:Lipoprotein n=1 Tax=Paraburkholderia humisilvae TaxID=627669 RepID=A0A6J5DEF0_9BURK|nr:hypothetical protein [Paraburkholderia humisilvae]CAB3751186.1 hypothetical protein LMG29542_01433 [Paraburkholderia humisilvae]
MKLLRTLLLLLLCVMLPITGLAASGLAGECPMQQSVAMQDDGSRSAVMPGCDSTKPAANGKAKAGFCKMSAQCQFGSLYYSGTLADVSRPAAPYHRVVFHYSQSLSIRAPDGLWRPPRAL